MKKMYFVTDDLEVQETYPAFDTYVEALRYVISSYKGIIEQRDARIRELEYILLYYEQREAPKRS